VRNIEFKVVVRKVLCTVLLFIEILVQSKLNEIQNARRELKRVCVFAFGYFQTSPYG